MTRPSLPRPAGRRTPWLRALHAEWTKQRTTPGPAGLLVATAVLTVATTAAIASVLTYDGSPHQDPVRSTLGGVQVAQVLVALLAVAVVSTDYSTGTILPTLTALPRRLPVLASKAVLVVAGVAAAGSVGVGGSLLVGGRILPARGFPPLPLAHEPTLRAAGGTVLYLALVALLSLGVATAVRDAAAAVGVVLGLLYGFPVLAHAVTDPDWQRRLRRLAPMDAGLAIQDTTGNPDLPIAPWPGLAVLAGWTLAALIAGALLLHRRDA
jgi:ABC-2 type transport system permease protein